DMPKKALNLVLYGSESGDTGLDVEYDDNTPKGEVYATEYEGIVNALKRWFAGGTTNSLQEWVEQFMELKTCETCGGARLRKESLWFRVAGKNIAELSAMNLNRLVDWFAGIE